MKTSAVPQGQHLEPPEAPPSPPAAELQPTEEDWQQLTGKKNKAKRKQLKKALNAGTQVSPNLYRAIYGSQASPFHTAGTMCVGIPLMFPGLEIEPYTSS